MMRIEPTAERRRLVLVCPKKTTEARIVIHIFEAAFLPKNGLLNHPKY